MSDRSTPHFETREHHSEASRRYDGVRTRRIVGFVVDYTFILLLWVPASVVVFLLGIVTFGLGWVLYGALLPIIAIAYIGFTLGGAAQATPGMRLAGVKLLRLDGGRVDPTLAILHGVLFWASNAVLTPLVLLVGIFTPKKQLLQDLLLGTVVVRDR
ncbi:MAG: RDD family protein [Rhizobiaceae bacterium]|nr:RDD family protein [Rhizobiaceae bacterium]